MSVTLLKKGLRWDEIPFNSQGGGCGGAMRAMCIGCYYVGESKVSLILPNERPLSHVHFLCLFLVLFFFALNDGYGNSQYVAVHRFSFLTVVKREQLVSIAAESCRMTHNHPTAILGAVTAALFTAFALEDIPVTQWGRKMVFFLPKVYVLSCGVRQ